MTETNPPLTQTKRAGLRKPDDVWEYCDAEPWRSRYTHSRPCDPSDAPAELPANDAGRRLRDQISIAILKQRVATLQSVVEKITAVVDIDEIANEVQAKSRLENNAPTRDTLRIWASHGPSSQTAELAETEEDLDW